MAKADKKKKTYLKGITLTMEPSGIGQPPTLVIKAEYTENPEEATLGITMNDEMSGDFVSSKQLVKISSRLLVQSANMEP